MIASQLRNSYELATTFHTTLRDNLFTSFVETEYVENLAFIIQMFVLLGLTYLRD